MSEVIKKDDILAWIEENIIPVDISEKEANGDYAVEMFIDPDSLKAYINKIATPAPEPQKGK